MTIRAIPSKRWFYWYSFSKGSAIVGALATFIILAFVAAVGVLGQHLVADSPRGFLADLTGALVATAALRRMNGSERGATLAMGVIPDVHVWTDQFVSQKVSDWATALIDSDIVAAAGILDDQTKGLGRKSSFEQRANWRQEQSTRLSSPELSIRAQAREDLVAMITTGYVEYQLRKRNGK